MAPEGRPTARHIALAGATGFGYTAQARGMIRRRVPMGYGVIGSPTGSGPVSLGSSPGTPATTRKQKRGCPKAAALVAVPGLIAVGAGSGGRARSGGVGGLAPGRAASGIHPRTSRQCRAGWCRAGRCCPDLARANARDQSDDQADDDQYDDECEHGPGSTRELAEHAWLVGSARTARCLVWRGPRLCANLMARQAVRRGPRECRFSVR